MRKQIKPVFVFLAVLLTFMAVAGFSCTAALSAEAETYKIGGIFPMTGTVASSGEYLRKGAQLAVDRINAEGGINGHRLELIIEDSKGVPRDGIMAFQKLVEVDKVPVVLPTLSSVVMAMIPEINNNEVVMINTLAKTNDLVGAGPRIFSITVPAGVDGITQAQFAYNELSARTAVMLYAKSDMGISYDQVMSEEFERLGGKMLAREGHDPATTDFRAVLTKIKQMDPDVVFILSQYQETATCIKQMRELGMDTQTVSYSAVMSGQFMEIAGEAANGHIVSVSGFDPEDPAEYVQRFVKDYEAAFNEPPIIDSAMIYDAVLMAAEAMRVGGYSADGITEGLKQMPGYKGATGVTEKFNEKLVVDRPVTMHYFQDGEWPLYGE